MLMNHTSKGAAYSLDLWNKTFFFFFHFVSFLTAAILVKFKTEVIMWAEIKI